MDICEVMFKFYSYLSCLFNLVSYCVFDIARSRHIFNKTKLARVLPWRGQLFLTLLWNKRPFSVVLGWFYFLEHSLTFPSCYLLAGCKSTCTRGLLSQEASWQVMWFIPFFPAMITHTHTHTQKKKIQREQTLVVLNTSREEWWWRRWWRW